MATTTTQSQPEVVDNEQKKNRSFKVRLTSDSESYGRYNGDSPYQAANKALSEIIRNKVRDNETVEGKITFWLIESTKGSCKRVHQYEGERIKLAEPVKYKVGENEIVKEYKNILKKIKKSEQTETVEKPKKVATKRAKVVSKSTKATKVAKVAKVATKSAKTTKATKVATKATKATTKTTKVATKATKTTKVAKKAVEPVVEPVVEEVVVAPVVATKKATKKAKNEV